MDEVFPGRKLDHRPFQLFMKRLRKKLHGRTVRYLMCGEYGEHTHRPHYHVILFGFSLFSSPTFDASRLIGLTNSYQGPFKAENSVEPESYFDERGCWHASRTLEEAWPYGNVQCERLNDNRIFYVAGYQLKDDASGEYPSYVRWSRRPGLGADWFDRFWADMYVQMSSTNVESSVVIGRRKVPFSCRYFDDRLSLISPSRYDILRACREMVGSSNVNNPDVEKAMLKALLNKVDVIKARLAKRTRDLLVTP